MKKIFLILVLLLYLSACEPEEPQTVTSEGEVTLTVTSLGYSEGKLMLDVQANTHSIDLSNLDFTQLATLSVDGTIYNPSSAPKLSGHHSTGQLVFDIPKRPKQYALLIKNVPDVPERTFTFGGS